MKKIPLTLGKFALVDDEDYDFLLQWKWHAVKKPNTYYASRKMLSHEPGYKRGKQIKMHRQIMGCKSENVIDHIDHNGLNNQKINLRITTNANNLKNRQSSKGSASNYLGVSLSSIKDKKYWAASIYSNYKSIYLGNFPYTKQGELDAANAYNNAAKIYHGDFANLNIIPDNYTTSIYTKNKTSIYRGVVFKLNRYIAKIGYNKTKIYLGSFKNEKEAAIAYNKKAEELYGSKAKLNIINL